MTTVLRDIGWASPDWDSAELLSVVVQGGIVPSNIVEVANHCEHWRQLFPQAEIILSISATDILTGACPGEVFGEPGLAWPYQDNGPFKSALDRLVSNCDKIVLARAALPLPPIKTDHHGQNNVNLQIAAARAGLELVTGRYVLRVRSDLIFLNRQFLSQYAEGEQLPRGRAAVFQQRVMISWLYTLNPYTIERMPLHFSDWFHFGLTEDVRQIWGGPMMSYADANHYKTNPYAPESNAEERMVVPRLAVEQHILYHCFRSRLVELDLKYHNDWSSIELATDVLIDNFNICDVLAAACLFNKYSFDFRAPGKLVHCIPRSDWIEMAEASEENRHHILKSRKQAIENPELAPFPREYTTESLHTKEGLRSVGEIAAPRDGVFLHGPYAMVPSGRYLATIHASICKGPGLVLIRATLDEGRQVLRERTILLAADEQAPPLTISFDVLDPQGANLEIVVITEGIRMMVVSGLRIGKRDVPIGFDLVNEFKACELPMRTDLAIADRKGAVTSGKSGHLLFGPWLTLAPGLYKAVFCLLEVARNEGAYVEVVVSGSSPVTLCKAVLLEVSPYETEVECTFRLEETREGIEFRLWVGKRTKLCVSSVRLERFWN